VAEPSPTAERRQAIARLKSEDWDLLVVGGGISGVGVLREAARRGWKAALIEQQDFAWGTSSRSSKMVHGGLRYLKEGQIGLTLHSVRERERLMREAPELVEPLGFIFPDCTGRKPGRWLFQLGLMVYGQMAGRNSRAHGHTYLNADGARALVPGLAPPGLQGATIYQDAVTDDARLVLRVLAEAQSDGALALNYVGAQQLSRVGHQAAGHINGAQAVDAHSGESLTIRAKAVVNATGAWADQLRGAVGGRPMLRPLRGSHLVVPHWRLPVAQAVSLMHPQDGRPVYFYPWEGVTLVGTTDLDHAGDANEEARITSREVDYLLAAVNDQMPGVQLAKADVIACFAGVRPVVDKDGGAGSAGGGKQAAASSASRDHVAVLESGLVTLTGGKLTTFRLMAHDALALAAGAVGKPFLPDDAPVLRPASSLGTDPNVNQSANQSQDISARARQRLQARYGAQAARVAAQAQPDDWQWVAGSNTLWLEVRIALRQENVLHLDDLLLRRTRLGLLLPHGAAACLGRVKTLCQSELGWTDSQWRAELSRYQALIARCYSLPEPQEETHHERAPHPGH
jgi:glycerol-3-phosphate dehydrogenase